MLDAGGISGGLRLQTSTLPRPRPRIKISYQGRKGKEPSLADPNSG